KVVSGFGVGTVKLKFQLDVELSDVQPPRSLKMSARGKAPGSGVDVRTTLEIEPVPPNRSRLKWQASSEVRGTVASVGARLLEGEAGVGKTEVGRTLAGVLKTELIRLQCYEGLDVATAVYEWDYPRQMLEIRLLEARGEAKRAATRDIFSEEFLIRRPLLRALENSRPEPPVLLIDEIDRADEEFEAYLLEVLADFAITIPEIGTIKAPPAR